MSGQKFKSSWTIEMAEEEPKYTWEEVAESNWHDESESNWDGETQFYWDERIKSKWDEETKSTWEEVAESNWHDENCNCNDWMDVATNNLAEGSESKVMAEKVKNKKSPSAAARVSPFWVFAVKEFGWTGLKGKDLAVYAGRPGAWPSMGPGERKKYIEEARRITKIKRARNRK